MITYPTLTDLPEPILGQIFEYLPSKKVRDLFQLFNRKIQRALDIAMERRAREDIYCFESHEQRRKFYESKKNKIRSMSLSINASNSGNFDESPYLSLFAKIEHLSELRVSRSFLINPRCIFESPFIQNLKKLNLNYTVLIPNENSIAALLPIESLQNNLRELRMNNEGYVFMRAMGASKIANLFNLTVLSLNNHLLFDAGIVEIAKLTNLIALSLRSNLIHERGTAELKKLSQLQYLDISLNPIGNEGMAHLGEVQSLVALDVELCDIDEKGALHFKRLHRLRHLVVDDNNIGVGCVHLTALEQLRILSVDQARIDDRGAANIAELQNLWALYIGKGNKITPTGLRQFNHLPKLSVIDLGFNFHGDEVDIPGVFPEKNTIWNNDLDFLKENFPRRQDINWNEAHAMSDIYGI